MALTKGKGATVGPKIQDNDKNNKVEINSVSNYIEFTTNNTLQGLIDNNGNFVLGTASGARGIEVVRSTSDTDFGLKLRNNSNGDIKLTMETAAQTFSFGIDNSDFDYLKLSTNTLDVGTGTLWTIKNDGSFGINIEPTSRFHVSGSIAQNIINLSANTLLDGTHNTVHVDATTGNITISLPAASSCTGRSYTVAKSDASANSVTIDPNSTETINGKTTIVLSGQYDWLELRSDGTNWIKEGTNEISGATICFDDGTEALPSLKYDSDATTGIYKSGVQELGFSTGGTARIFIKNQGLINNIAGTSAEPSYSWFGDEDTGFYLSATNEVSATTNGVQRLQILSGGETVVKGAQLRLQAGTTTVPALSFESDTNLGLYRRGANDLGITTDGALRVSITDTGLRVIDGTQTSPSISFIDDLDLGFYRMGADQMLITAGGLNVAQLDTLGITIAANKSLFLQSGSAASPSLRFAGDDDTGLYRPGPNLLAFTTTGVERLRIGDNGNITLPIADQTISWTGGDGIINSNTSLYINLDANNNNADDTLFQISKNRTGKTGGTALLAVRESGEVDVFENILCLNSNRIADVADPINPQDAVTKAFLDAGFQPLDADLTALAANTGTGLLTRTGPGTIANRAVTESTANAITITNGDGVAGDPVINIQAGLDSIAGLTTAADTMIYTSASNVYMTTPLTSYMRTLLDDPDEATARNTLGLVAGGAGDIWVEKAGDTMTGFLTLNADPTNALHAVTKQYADSISAGLDPKESVKGATDTDISGTYNASGGTGASGAFTNVDLTSDAIFDGVPTLNAYAIGDRILIKDQSDAKQNGLYIVTTAGASGAIERAPDHDGSPLHEVSSGNSTAVTLGTKYGGSTWNIKSGSGTLNLNVDDIDWGLVANATDWTWGNGLTNVGNIVSAVLEGTGSAQTLGTLSFNSDAIAVDLGFTSTTAMPGNANLADLNNVTETGLATGNLLFKSSGDWTNSQNLYWDSSNNRLGVGEPTPTHRLHVTSNTVDIAATFESLDSGGGIKLKDNTGEVDLFVIGDLLEIRPAGGSSVLDIASTYIEAKQDFRVPNGTALSPSITFTDDLDSGFYRVGPNTIGVSAGGQPRATFDIISLTMQNNAVIRSSSGSTSSPGYAFDAETNSGMYRSGVGNVDIVRLGSNHTRFTNNQIRSVNGTLANPTYSFFNSVSSGMYQADTNQIGLVTNGAEALRIDASQNVGIGQTVPTDKLEVFTNSVNGGISIKGGNFPGLKINDTTDNAAAFIGSQNGGILEISADNGNQAAGSAMIFRVDSAEVGRFNTNLDFVISNAIELGGNAAIENGTAATAATTQVPVFTFAVADYVGAKVVVCVTDTTATERHIVEILITHDGVTAVATQYADVITATDLATFDVDISSGNVRLLATPASTNNMTFKTISQQLLA